MQPLIHVDPNWPRWHASSAMKAFFLAMAPAILALASCEMMNAPLGGTGSFDPLAPPGSGSGSGTERYEPDLSPGTFVTANIPNTAFYKNKPKDGADADKLLSLGTNMKIVSADSSYVKVELDSGEVGWVPSVMVASASAGPDIQPIDGNYPIPPVYPDGLPPGDSIPAIIDPDAPVTDPGDPIKIDPVPELKPLEPDSKPEEGDVEESAD